MLVIVWAGIVICLAHSAVFSGLNLALLGLTRLRLEVEASAGNLQAQRILHLRKDAHFLLTTILWGNVAFNTLLAILANSVMAGVYAFLFSTVFITFLGEIVPQAYFSRHAIRIGALLLLDRWLGEEGIRYFREHQLREVIQKHIEADEGDVDRLEGLGALNFLALDDLPLFHEGEILDPDSIIELPVERSRPIFPAFKRTPDDPFLQRVQRSGHKWITIVREDGQPVVVLDADGFLRAALFEARECQPMRYCHRPIIVRDEKAVIGDVIPRLKVEPETPEDDVIDQDIILVWSERKRIITGADILGRLLRGIVPRKK